MEELISKIKTAKRLLKNIPDDLFSKLPILKEYYDSVVKIETDMKEVKSLYKGVKDLRTQIDARLKSQEERINSILNELQTSIE